MVTGAVSIGDLTVEDALSGRYRLTLSDLECLSNRLKRILSAAEQTSNSQRGRNYEKWNVDYVRYMNLPEHEQLKSVNITIKQLSDRILKNIELYGTGIN